jgi:hypothetical protein
MELAQSYCTRKQDIVVTTRPRVQPNMASEVSLHITSIEYRRQCGWPVDRDANNEAYHDFSLSCPAAFRLVNLLRTSTDDIVPDGQPGQGPLNLDRKC